MREKVSPEQYIDRVNEKMRDHGAFRPGMSVRSAPKAASRPWGITFDHSIPRIAMVVEWAEGQLMRVYEVVA